MAVELAAKKPGHRFQQPVSLAFSHVCEPVLVQPLASRDVSWQPLLQPGFSSVLPLGDDHRLGLETAQPGSTLGQVSLLFRILGLQQVFGDSLNGVLHVPRFLFQGGALVRKRDQLLVLGLEAGQLLLVLLERGNASRIRTRSVSGHGCCRR